MQSFCQTIDTFICDKVVGIDTVEYKTNFIKSDLLHATKHFDKMDGKLTIKTKTRAYTFIDNFEHGDYNPLYKVAGEEIKKNWIWIEEQSLHTVRYFLINTETSRIDTLIGLPKIFGDKIVCLEEPYTDSPQTVEIYKIKNDKIIQLRKFKLNPCDKLCCVRTIYLNGKTIFIAANDYKQWTAWKAKVL
jgi:hypothetical protein